MHFWIEDDGLPEKYNTTWEEPDSEPVYNKEFLKTKIKSHCDEVTDFYDRKIPKMDSNYTCLVVISLDSALKKHENLCPQVYLRKYTEKYI